MKILVTGANGYMGQGIVRQLLDKGHEVIAADRKDSGIDARAEIIETNVFDISSPYDFFGKPDAVLHLAWRNGFVHNDRSHIDDLPLHYTFLKNIIEGGCTHLGVLGSMHEVGFYEGSIKADTPTNPQSLYGIAKDALRRSVELVAKQYAICFQWIRGYYIVGNTEHGSSIFSKITAAEKEGKHTFPFTSGLNQWDFLDYDDFCGQVVSVIEQNKYTGIINACSGRPEKLADRVERFIKENNYKISLAYGSFPDRPYDSKAVWGDDSIIKRILEDKGC